MPEPARFIRKHVARAVAAASSGNWPCHCFRFGNLALDLHTSNRSIADTLTPVIEHARDANRNVAGSRIIAVDAGASDFPFPPEHWPFETDTMDGRLRLCWRPEESVAMVSDESRGIWHLFDFRTMSGLYWVNSSKGLPFWEHGSPLRHFIQWTAIACAPATSMVHGAVLSFNGHGVLLAGPGGSGKSTLTAAAIRSGWQTVGDDFILIDCGLPKITGYSIYDIMKLTGMAETLFADAVKLAINPHRKDTEKALVPISRAAETAFVGELQISDIAVVGLSDETASRLVPASKFDVVAALAPSTMKVLRTGLQQTHTFCSQLARQLPAVKLVSGQDPMETLSRLQCFLEGRKQ